MDEGTVSLWRRRLKRAGIGGTIAVVGNAPTEMKTGHGDKIDAHDTVIRFNNYELGGYEQDYGKRTTHWATTFWFDIVHRDLSQFKKTLCPFPLNDKDFIGKYFANKYHAAHDIFYVTQNKTRIECIPFPVFEEALSLVGTPSAGFLFLFWLKTVWGLRGVSLFGFNFFDNKEGLHYFDLAERITHKGNDEKHLIQKWIGESKWRM